MNEPIVYIHGLMNGLAHLNASEHFTPRKVLVPNLVGYGANIAAGMQVDLLAQVEFIAQLFDQQGIERAHIVGHSVGGAIAVLLAKAHPDRVTSIVNVEGNFTLKDAFWSSKIAAMSPEEVAEFLRRDRSDPRGWLVRNRIEPKPDRIAWTKAMFETSPLGTVQAVARSVVEITSRPEYLADVRDVLDAGFSMHLIAGERSRNGWDVPAFVLDRAASFQIQPGVGHMMMLEEPEEFVSLVANTI
ncbi:MAG: alpha/beta hydrolase [Planctomycetes bacterium]|nr:alpha/beta hydrolase [Planctomycetota bacterium]MBI3834842.1 alpha/beta hydrolase [Planctomycetota bacterium]